MTNLPLKGPLSDSQLPVLEEAGLVIDGDKIVAVGAYTLLLNKYPSASLHEITEDLVLLPGFIDCHTHISSAMQVVKL